MRRELKIARTQIHDLEAALGMHSKKNKNDPSAVAAFTIKGPSALMQSEMEEKNKIIDMQKLEIKRLRMEITDIEMGSRPSSSQRLPPVQPIESVSWNVSPQNSRILKWGLAWLGTRNFHGE